MNARPSPDNDAAMVLGMASTAMAFARTPAAEAERWLRILRLHGQAGIALQALGVGESSLEAPCPDAAGQREPVAASAKRDTVAEVAEAAVLCATERGSATVSTTDVLRGVMDVYGACFDGVLRVHGTDRDEVLERLGASPRGTLAR